MPKKSPRNSYYFFMLQVKEDHRKKGINYANMTELANAANPLWRDAPPHVRKIYEDRAKKEKTDGGLTNKFTSLGESLESVKNKIKEDEDNRLIEKKVINSMVKTRLFNDNGYDDVFYVMDVNSYCQTQYNYVIAEFTIVRFSLRDGIIDEYHRVVNPGSLPMGYNSDGKIACEEMGLEMPSEDTEVSNYFEFLAHINEYLQCPNKSTKPENADLPPLFTLPNKVNAIQDFLSQLCHQAGENPDMHRVYKLNTLFFVMVNTIKRLENQGFPQESLALVQLNKDLYKFQQGMACKYHEQGEKFHKCTQSRCKRWVYSILSHCCPLALIDPLPGKHLPLGIDMDGVKNAMNIERHRTLSEPEELNNAEPYEEPWSVVSTKAKGRQSSNVQLAKPKFSFIKESHFSNSLKENAPVLSRGRGRGPAPKPETTVKHP